MELVRYFGMIYNGSLRSRAFPCATHMAVVAVTALLVWGCAGASAVVTAPILSEDLVERLEEIRLVPLAALNTSADDFGLAMPLDTTIAFFTSSGSEALGDHSIFYSRKMSGVWGAPALAVEVNNGKSSGVPSLTPGGEGMYFTGCNMGLGDCDLYYVESGLRGSVPEETTPWMVPANLGLGINGIYWESQPAISADGSVLVFSSDRPGGLGGKDIWMCRRRRDGAWDRPVNAGEAINTAFDEVTPSISPDGQLLYFSSNGQPGLGGFDVFSVPIEQGEIPRVVNLGVPINSSSNEISFTFSADGSQLFLASNRSGGKGGYDLYRVLPVPFRVDPVMIVGGGISTKDGAPLFGTVEVANLATGEFIGTFRSNPETGAYHIVAPRGVRYSITAQAAGYLFHSRQIAVPHDLEKNEKRTLDFSLEPVNGVIRLLVFFSPAQNLLERESVNDLDRAVRFLSANPDVNVEIAGHTDNVGDPTTNLQLSLERAQAVKSYLVGNSIDANRLTVKGYGAARPVAANDMEEGRAMNRRVEMRILN